eukprot:COSAG02_NODE_67252_length_253_cov_0.746753_1_plen_35_part_10
MAKKLDQGQSALERKAGVKFYKPESRPTLSEVASG